MSAEAVEPIDLSKELFGMENDPALDLARQGVGPLSHRDDQPIVFPAYFAGAKTIKILTSLQMSTAAFGHGPSLLPRAVERHVDGTVVLRVDGVASSSGTA